MLLAGETYGEGRPCQWSSQDPRKDGTVDRTVDEGPGEQLPIAQEYVCCLPARLHVHLGLTLPHLPICQFARRPLVSRQTMPHALGSWDRTVGLDPQLRRTQVHNSITPTRHTRHTPTRQGGRRRRDEHTWPSSGTGSFSKKHRESKSSNDFF